MENMLCPYACPGPCRKSEDYIVGSGATEGPDFPCENGTFWDCGTMWMESPDITKDCEEQEKGVKYNGVDFMLAYNLFHMAEGTNYEGYYNPHAIESSDLLTDVEIDINGTSHICAGVEERYVMIPGTPNFEQSWTTSQNLQINSVNTNPDEEAFVQIPLNIPNENGSGWIELTEMNEDTTLLDDCIIHPTVRKNVWLGKPDFDIIQGQTRCAVVYVDLIDKAKEENPNLDQGASISWSFVNTNPAVTIATSIASDGL